MREKREREEKEREERERGERERKRENFFFSLGYNPPQKFSGPNIMKNIPE